MLRVVHYYHYTSNMILQSPISELTLSGKLKKLKPNMRRRWEHYEMNLTSDEKRRFMKLRWVIMAILASVITIDLFTHSIFFSSYPHKERKNGQINTLMKNHEKAFSDIKNYYNDITLNNLALINTLKEQVGAFFHQSQAQSTCSCQSGFCSWNHGLYFTPAQNKTLVL